jgi:hypothetical protein
VSNHLVHPASVLHSPEPLKRAFWVQDWLGKPGPEEACLELVFANGARACLVTRGD